MIPLQYVNAEELVWLFRVPHPLRVSKGGGLDSTTTGIVEIEGAEKPHPCKRRKGGAPASSTAGPALSYGVVFFAGAGAAGFGAAGAAAAPAFIG